MSTPFHHWLVYVIDGPLFGYILYRFVQARRNKPSIHKGDIVYQEWFASGCSKANLLTRIGGASRCLHLVVTPDLLWVTSWFPFTLLTGFYDLEHVIPLDAIDSIVRKQWLFTDRLELTYHDHRQKKHTLLLMPRNIEGFTHAVQRRVS